MRRILACSFVLITLAALTVAPGFAAEVDHPVTPDQPNQIDFPVEELLMTPAEDPEMPDLVDPSQDTLERKIRQCEEWEAETCGTCDCIFHSGAVQCYC